MRRLIGFAIRDMWYKLGEKSIYAPPSLKDKQYQRLRQKDCVSVYDLSFRQPQDLFHTWHSGSNPGDDTDPWRGTEKSHHPHLLWHDHLWTRTLWKLSQGTTFIQKCVNTYRQQTSAELFTKASAERQIHTHTHTQASSKVTQTENMVFVLVWIFLFLFSLSIQFFHHFLLFFILVDFIFYFSCSLRMRSFWSWTTRWKVEEEMSDTWNCWRPCGFKQT